MLVKPLHDHPGDDHEKEVLQRRESNLSTPKALHTYVIGMEGLTLAMHARRSLSCSADVR